MQGRETRVFVERKRRTAHPYEAQGFMLISKAGLAELLARMNDHTLGMQAMRVLVAMAESVDYENRVEASQKELCGMLGMSPSDVSQASRLLVQCGFIEPLRGRRGWYRISPRLLWRGSARTLRIALDQRAA